MEKKIVLKVEGMSCAHCVNHVEKALKDVLGTVSVNVNLAAGSAEVSFNDEITTVASLCEAVVDAGYTASA